MNQVNPVSSEFVAFVNQLLLWVVGLVVPIAIGYVVKQVLPEVVAFYKANTDESQRRLLEMIVAQVVKAAEESKLKAKIEGAAFNAFEYAVTQVKAQLASYGWGQLAIDTVIGLIKAEIQKQLTEEGPPVAAGTRELDPNKHLALKDRLWA